MRLVLSFLTQGTRLRYLDSASTMTWSRERSRSLVQGLIHHPLDMSHLYQMTRHSFISTWLRLSMLRKVLKDVGHRPWHWVEYLYDKDGELRLSVELLESCFYSCTFQSLFHPTLPQIFLYGYIWIYCKLVTMQWNDHISCWGWEQCKPNLHPAVFCTTNIYIYIYCAIGAGNGVQPKREVMDTAVIGL